MLYLCCRFTGTFLLFWFWDGVPPPRKLVNISDMSGSWDWTFIFACISSISFLVSGSCIILGSTVINSSGITIIITMGLNRTSVTFHSSLFSKYLYFPSGLALIGYGSWFTWEYHIGSQSQGRSNYYFCLTWFGWTGLFFLALCFPLELMSTLVSS